MRSAFPPGHVWVFSLLNIKDQAACLPPHVCGSPSVPGFCLLHAGLLVHETGCWGFLCGSKSCLLNSDFYMNVTTLLCVSFLGLFFCLRFFLVFLSSRMSPVGAVVFEKLTVRLTFQPRSIRWCPVFLSSHSLLYSCVSGLCFLELSLEGLCWLAAHWRLFSWL